MSAPGEGARPGMPAWRLAAYAAPVIGTSALIGPAVAILPGIYAKYFGLSLATLGLVSLVVRLVDAVASPAIGYLSDAILTRTGSRKAPIVAGGLAFLLSGWLLFVPPAGAGAAWFGIWTLVFFLAWSLFEIAHSAWGSELAPGYQERSRLFAFRAFAFYIGGLLFYLVPFAPFLGDTSITPRTLRLAVLVVVAILLPALAGIAWLRGGAGASPRAPHGERASVLSAVLANRPLRLFLAAYLLSGLGLGMWTGLLFIGIDTYFGLASKVAFIFAVSAPIAMVATPIWYRVIARCGKRVSWAVSTLVVATVVAACGLLPRSGAAFVPLVVLVGTLFLAGACQGVTAPAVLADVADYGHWRFRRDVAGTYYAVFALVTKATTGLGTAAGLGLAGLLGFDPKSATQSPQALLGMKVAFAFVPALLVVAAVPLILATPIDARRQGIIRRRLEGRKQRAERATLEGAAALKHGA
jgi:glycoside/pentoside/hexuronide:cation symporter, GPH family